MSELKKKKDGKPENETADIKLFYQYADGVSGGKRIGISSCGIYHAADGTAVITHDSPRKFEERYVIPPEVEKTKEAILRYLKDKYIIPEFWC